jgi:hypothetical protein
MVIRGESVENPRVFKITGHICNGAGHKYAYLCLAVQTYDVPVYMNDSHRVTYDSHFDKHDS